MIRLASANIFKGMSLEEARAAVDTVLIRRPDILALQEWGSHRDGILRKLPGYGFCRPAEGGGPVVYGTRFSPVRCRAVVLARREFVGHLIGRKSQLPASVANLTILCDDKDGGEVAVVNFHLTAEVQYGGTYRRDLGHALRVRRHRRERRRLSRLVRRQQHKGRTVYALGDGNFDGMTLPPLRSCWRGRKGGTLGGRAVDVVFAETESDAVKTIDTGSDHRAVVVTYKEL